MASTDAVNAAWHAVWNLAAEYVGSSLCDDFADAVAEAIRPLAIGWQPIETASKVVDKTVLLRIEHANLAIASANDRHRWEEIVTAYWTDHNKGGWVWHGLAGTPTHWRPVEMPDG